MEVVDPGLGKLEAAVGEELRGEVAVLRTQLESVSVRLPAPLPPTRFFEP